MSDMSRNSDRMSLHAHIKELRMRLFAVSVVFLMASVLAYTFADPLYSFLTVPLEGEKLYNTTVGGGFSFILQLILWVGVAVTLPFLIVALYGFISPILPTQTKKKTSLVFMLSLGLFVAGAAFGYYVAMPGAMRFLLNFADGKIIPIITGDSYLHFLLAYTIGTGILFQIPLLMMIINWIKPLSPKKLLNFERYVIVAAFAAAAVITPTPDPVNQTIIAAPVVAMYQVGFVAVATSQRKTRKSMRRKQATVTTQAPVVHATEKVPSSTPQVAPLAVGIPPARVVRSVDGVHRRASVGKVQSVRSSPVRVLVAEPRRSVQRSAPRSIDGMRPYQRPIRST